MSDFEDDDVMEVDGGKTTNDDSMTFHALDKKGKRSAVDLPVELEDTLPWCITFLVESCRHTKLIRDAV